MFFTGFTGGIEYISMLVNIGVDSPRYTKRSKRSKITPKIEEGKTVDYSVPGVKAREKAKKTGMRRILARNQIKQ